MLRWLKTQPLDNKYTPPNKMKLTAALALNAATFVLAQKGGGAVKGVNPTGPYKGSTSYWVEPGLAKNTIFAPKDVPGLKLPVSIQQPSADVLHSRLICSDIV
jgi:hypothetical protein